MENYYNVNPYKYKNKDKYIDALSIALKKNGRKLLIQIMNIKILTLKILMIFMNMKKQLKKLRIKSKNFLMLIQFQDKLNFL